MWRGYVGRRPEKFDVSDNHLHVRHHRMGCHESLSQPLWNRGSLWKRTDNSQAVKIEERGKKSTQFSMMAALDEAHQPLNVSAVTTAQT
jgi:hypothetical protein